MDLGNQVEVCGTDHPLSLGKKLYLTVLDHPSPEGWHGFCVDAKNSESGHHELYIYFSGDKVRLIELLVHEVSHFVDNIFAATKVTPCTELRAYYNDWVMGKACHAIDIFDQA